MDREYRQALDRVHMTAEGKRALAGQLAAGAVRAAPAPKHVLRGSLVATAIACLLLATAGAIALNTPILRKYLGGGAAYDRNALPLELSQTVDGYTITVTDCVGDDQFLYLGIELTGPEGTVINPGLRIGDGDETVKFSGFEQGIGSGGGLRILEDDDPTDNKMCFVWFRWVEKSLAGRDMTITFHNLTHREWAGDGVPSREVVDVEGDWSFGPFRLGFTDQAIDAAPGVQVPLLGGEATVTAVKITPLHVEVRMEGGWLEEIHTSGPEKDGCWGLCTKETTVALYGRDGTRWELPEPDHSGSWVDDEGDCTSVMLSYHQLLDLDELGFIEVCGVKIPISGYK